MIEADQSKAIYHLRLNGMSIRKIAKEFRTSRNTIRRIVKNHGQTYIGRKNKITIEPSLLERHFQECNGFVQRIHEKLVEEEGIRIGYSTLTRLLRKLEISKEPNPRCSQVADQPGAEMQHDTSVYNIKIDGRETKVVASLIYFRYSKIRFLKFYLFFTRFHMKCFFYEALTHYGYVAFKCIIDNTHLAVLRGTGENAVFVAEMINFAKSFDFQWQAHAIMHSNRKAGNERSFWTVETNFFPGRSFKSIEDLNEQAFNWATDRFARRPLSKTKLIPIELFETEKSQLKKIPIFVNEPYLEHQRQVDQYGYISFDGNFYWIPGTKRGVVLVLQYRNRIKIFDDHKKFVKYEIPVIGTKLQKYSPNGIPAPIFGPRKGGKSIEEEMRLKKLDPQVESYLSFAIKEGLKPRERYQLMRRLFKLSQTYSKDCFINIIKRAHNYKVIDIDAIERIGLLLIKNDKSFCLPFIDESYEKRQSFMDGDFTDEPDFSIYDSLLGNS